MKIPLPLAIIGPGRLGSALDAALRRCGEAPTGPLGRDYSPAELGGPALVLLCVPDGEIAGAALTLAERLDGPAPLVAHCSGALGLDVLGDFEGFSLHPLMSVPHADDGSALRGAGAALAADTPRALEAGRALAAVLGLRAVSIAERDRAAYHAAAAMASNFLVTLELAAERLALDAGADRELLIPLVRRTVDNWARQGASALTGPIARGDETTVARQRAAVAERRPELLELFDALCTATRSLAASPAGVAA